MKTVKTTGQMTSEDFERWLSLQAAIGFTVKNPDAVEKIRSAFKRGATCTPFKQTDCLTDCRSIPDMQAIH